MPNPEEIIKTTPKKGIFHLIFLWIAYISFAGAVLSFFNTFRFPIFGILTATVILYFLLTAVLCGVIALIFSYFESRSNNVQKSSPLTIVLIIIIIFVGIIFAWGFIHGLSGLHD